MYVEIDNLNGYYLPHTTHEEELKLLEILFCHLPTKNQRMFLVGRLKSFGYNELQVLEVIRKYNKWNGYNEKVTERWIDFIFRNPGAGKTITHGFFKPASGKIFTLEQLKKEFFKNAQIIPKLNVPSGKDEAAWFYYNLGYHVVPKDPKGKYPSVAWKQYQIVRPGVLQMTKWDWSNGLCLLAANGYCFLDIDIQVDDPDYGHFERTPRGGLHIFGKGNPKSIKVTGIGEIKGMGTLIVSYPTEGYKI